MRILKAISIILAAGLAALPVKVIAQQEGNMPASTSAQMPTGIVAARLNNVANSLLASGNSQDDVSSFLLRCVFSCFAEDCGVLPRGAFQKVLVEGRSTPGKCAPALTALWKGMKNSGGGWLFENPESLALSQEQVTLLAEATVADWSQINTTVLGTIAEHALEPLERKQLGVHYTPAEYVERLVYPTVIEPLQQEWQAIDKKDAAAVRRFHERLCNTVILDPACGSGNFLSVSFELLNGLDSMVLATLHDLGQPQPDRAISIQQFRGIEIAPHAADVCELALRVSWLRSYCKAHKAPPSTVDNHRVVECRDALLTSATDAHPAVWPNCEFVVGNPPFVGSKKKRQALGDNYVKALSSAYDDIPGSSDLVMYWWAKAADLLRDGKIHRFGFITTNSIRSKNNAKIVDDFLCGQPPISIVFAIPDHPWKAGTAQVRIAMTICEKGDQSGILASAAPGAKQERGKITSKLSIGADVARAKPLKANDGICTKGMMLCNPGFIVTPEQAKTLGLGSDPEVATVIKDYANGRDVSLKSRDVLVIDLSDVKTEDEVKRRFPKIYDYLLVAVKSRVDGTQSNWWQFGNKKEDLRGVLSQRSRYIATVETSKNHPFIFLGKEVVPDNKLIVIGSDSACLLGILSSRIHDAWTISAGSRLGKTPVYTKTAVFDTFPFPVLSPGQTKKIGDIAEKLDVFRAQHQKEHRDLTLSAIYSVLDKVQDGEQLTAKESLVAKDADIDQLAQIQADLDTAVFEAYGWPKDLSDEQIVEKVLALNQQRAAEEQTGKVRSLRSQF